MIHELKTWPSSFQAILDGSKTFEFRRNDRGFKVGDVLHLREWGIQACADQDEPGFHSSAYTGRELFVTVTYLLGGGGFGIPVGFCIMSIVPAEAP